jgi:hypothetical protein
MASQIKTELEEIFDSITDTAKSMSDEGDDNGYSIGDNASGKSFEEKVDDLNAATSSQEAGLSLGGPSDEPSTPKNEPAPPAPVLAEADEVGDALDVDLVKDKVPADGLEDMLKESLKSDGNVVSSTEENSNEISSVEESLSASSEEDAFGIDDESVKNEPEEIRETLNASSENDDNTSVKDDTQDDDNSWVFSPPAPKFADFYNVKRNVVERILINGKLPFDVFQDELADAFVRMGNSTFDPVEQAEKMKEVQTWRDRIEMIRSQASDQYFLWKRHMDILRGMAGRAENAKGAAVDAAAGTHLLDCEYYWGRLEALYKKTEGVIKSLDAAYESLSRQATLCLPDASVERYDRSKYKSNIEDKSNGFGDETIEEEKAESKSSNDNRARATTLSQSSSSQSNEDFDALISDPEPNDTDDVMDGWNVVKEPVVYDKKKK